MTIYQLDPLRDSRWSEFVERKQGASVFHTPAWLAALERTYGYQPVVWTTAAPGDLLRDGLVFCLVDTWLTGRRLVSLPFSDHCEPLVERPGDLKELIGSIQEIAGRDNMKFLELRPRSSGYEYPHDFGPSQTYTLHRLDLAPDLAKLFRNLHKDCIQRKIKRAEREGLKCEKGRSEELLRKFYQLFLLTRRRHRLPPQPLSWFRNVLDSLGEMAEIRMASKGAQPAAAILTLRFRDSMTYKYGCSDESLNHAGGMPLLMWKMIENAKQQGLREVDLGRSDQDNPGLITFKSRLGGDSTPLRYMRSPAPSPEKARSDWKLAMARKIFAWMPETLLRRTGERLYRHVG